MSASKIESSINFPIVGIGASAGGLEAFSELLKALPTDTGIAFVLIQHLDPHHKSFLRDALVKTTSMPVQEIVHGLKLAPNNVYVLPPNYDLAILDCELSLIPRDITFGTLHLPINTFFASLSKNCERRAIGVVLSGNASDGTDGLRTIKDEGGFTFAQAPQTSKYRSMPESAINAGVVDFVLPIAELALELARLAHHPYYFNKNSEPFSELGDQENLGKILVYIKQELGVDFSEYKVATIKRRLIRRLALLRINTLIDYLKYLEDNKSEAKALCEDILIHVTSFFRDPEAFKKLKGNVFPLIVASRQPNAPIRIWVAGCSTGEEVYSIAISLLEYLQEFPASYPIQIFGSDISELMIEKCRAGIYPDCALSGIEPELIKRYFIKVDHGYRINKIVRDLCVFVRHDLARDPPFSRLDLITCRNVLIYFDQALQKRILSTFHYCLKQPGFMMLGRTENVSSHQQYFSTEDKVNKIFSRNSVESQLRFQMPKEAAHIDDRVFEVPRKDSYQPQNDVSKTIDKILLEDYAPCGVLINDRLEVLQYRGRTSLYLEQPPGQPEVNLMKILKEGLFVELQMAIAKSRKEMATVRKEDVRVKGDGTTSICNIVVRPIMGFAPPKEPQFLVLFEEVLKKEDTHSKFNFFKRMSKKEQNLDNLRSQKLEKELEITKEYLQSLNHEHQKTNDTLATANEEFVSGNEELQSMNEELETAKEELQSINEELTTVNDELQNRNLEVGQVNNDLVNLLNSVEIPIVILDLNRRIRRFTPHARSIMNLLQSDIGRPMDDIKLNVEISDLDRQIDEVIRLVRVKESEVQDKNGSWFRIQIRPYKTLEDKVEGVVISLIDINILRKAVGKAEWARDYATSIVEGFQIPLVVLDREIKVISANHAFYKKFMTSKTETVNKLFYSICKNQWDIPSFRDSLGDMLGTAASFRNMEVEFEFPNHGKQTMSLSAQTIYFEADVPSMILLAIEDITLRKESENEKLEMLRVAEQSRAETLEVNHNLASEKELRERFVNALSHDLRTPLAVARMSAEMMIRKNYDLTNLHKLSTRIISNMERADSMIRDLLDANRLKAGEALTLDVQTCNLNDLARKSIEDLSNIFGDRFIVLSSEIIEGIWDCTAIRRIIENLSSNAVKYGTPGSKVTLTLLKKGAEVLINVHNEGNPITPLDQKNIFEVFQRSETAIKSAQRGWGIGLTLVKGLVESHGGQLTVNSSEQDGTNFTVTIPLDATIPVQV